MPIWKLQPTEHASDDWTTSLHRGAAIVRAPTEDLARQIAAEAFSMPVASAAERARLFSPWTQRELVRCFRLEQSTFSEDGPPTILDPPHWGDTSVASLA
jgi:hypothetical protein